MEQLDILAHAIWQPLQAFGITHPLLYVHSTTIYNTWIVLAIIAIGCSMLRSAIKKNKGMVSFVCIQGVAAFRAMVTQALAAFSPQHFSFITALFVYIVLCNSIAIFPGATEPTKDLNTTLALGIISFVYVQWYAIRAHGLWAYIKEYFAPFFIMFPLHVIGKLSTIISISFRLFGNIFGGATIAHIYFTLIYGSVIWESIGVLSGINFAIMVFFGLFEGFIQAFVFAMLSLTYLATAISPEEPVVPNRGGRA